MSQEKEVEKAYWDGKEVMLAEIIGWCDKSGFLPLSTLVAAKQKLAEQRPQKDKPG